MFFTLIFVYSNYGYRTVAVHVHCYSRACLVLMCLREQFLCDGYVFRVRVSDFEDVSNFRLEVEELIR